MSSKDAVQVELINIVADVVGLRHDRIHPKDRLIEDLGLDSFSATELLVLVDQYNLEVLQLPV